VTAPLTVPPEALPRLRPVPVVEPRAASRVAVEGDDERDGVLRPSPQQAVLAFPVPFPGPSPALAVEVPGGRAGAHAWALHFTQAALEVVAGLRTPAQLVRWTSPDVQVALRRRHALARRAGARPPRSTVRSVHVTQPARGVAEVAAVVTDGVRHRALAFRMEGTTSRWRVTALELG
jgi:Family of unknown function (DUF6459)